MPHLGWPSLWKQNPSLGNTGDDMPRQHLHDEGPVLGSPVSQVKTSGCAGYITTGHGPQVSHHKAQARWTFAKKTFYRSPVSTWNVLSNSARACLVSAASAMVTGHTLGRLFREGDKEQAELGRATGRLPGSLDSVAWMCLLSF